MAAVTLEAAAFAATFAADIDFGLGFERDSGGLFHKHCYCYYTKSSQAGPRPEDAEPKSESFAAAPAVEEVVSLCYLCFV